MDSLNGAQWFSTLDLASGYWQVDLDPRDKEKTAFSIPGKGHYQFRVMPFGLTGAPATFERMMEGVLAPLLWNKCLSFLDDVMVFGRSFELAIQNLEEVFSSLQAAGLKLKPSKCKLFRRSLAYLGYAISSEGVSCDSRNVEAVRDWPVPTSLTEVRGFLGSANYYRQFIERFADMASPLTRLTRKRTPFVWSESCQEAFVTLKRLKRYLTSAPILGYPLEEERFILDTDASDFALGVCFRNCKGSRARHCLL